MAYLDPTQAVGDMVKMARTNPLHLAGTAAFGSAAATDAPASSAGATETAFGKLLMSALGNVNDSQLNAATLSQRMITDPNSVNVEDVTIALADANLALSMTKAIVDRALAAYREIINVR
jgi:flagellar hook-basal body complex protein FliE